MKRESGVNPERARRCNPISDSCITRVKSEKLSQPCVSLLFLLKAGRPLKGEVSQKTCRKQRREFHADQIIPVYNLSGYNRASSDQYIIGPGFFYAHALRLPTSLPLRHPNQIPEGQGCGFLFESPHCTYYFISRSSVKRPSSPA
jgi:hypothetical protein